MKGESYSLHRLPRALRRAPPDYVNGALLIRTHLNGGYSLQTSKCRGPVAFVVMPARITPSAIADCRATHRLM